MFARNAARSLRSVTRSVVPRVAAPRAYSTSHTPQPKATSGDLPWAVTSFVVFGGAFLYLTSPDNKKSSHGHHDDHSNKEASDEEEAQESEQQQTDASSEQDSEDKSSSESSQQKSDDKSSSTSDNQKEEQASQDTPDANSETKSDEKPSESD